MRNTKLVVAFLVASIVMLSGAAFAGGPLIVDPITRTAYTFGPETVPVYYDLGNLGSAYDSAPKPGDLRQFGWPDHGGEGLHTGRRSRRRHSAPV